MTTNKRFESQIENLSDEEKAKIRYHGDALKTARQLARQGDGTCTIDEVRQLCPPPEGIDSHVMRSIFQRSEWVSVSKEKSTRPGSRGRKITRYANVNYY